MLTDTPGIHHVTAMVGDPQANLEFYVDVLGLRLVKRTVNHEDVLRYHFYYGNGRGDLGTIYTCFPYPNEPPGRRGRPQLTAASFAVPPGSLEYWTERLADRGVETERRERFDESVLRFEDPAGTRLELVASESPVDPWSEGPVPEAVAVRGVHGVTASSADPFQTASVLETLGFDLEVQEGDRVRYRAPGDRATVVDLLDREAGFGREGVGTIHHVALRVPDEDDLLEWHDLFRERGVDVSRMRDRHYYRAIYVREPGGILIELSTESPGLTVDEDEGALGTSLVLPPWAEADREMIEDQLPPIEVPTPPGGDVQRDETEISERSGTGDGDGGGDGTEGGNGNGGGEGTEGRDGDGGRDDGSG